MLQLLLDITDLVLAVVVVVRREALPNQSSTQANAYYTEVI